MADYDIKEDLTEDNLITKITNPSILVTNFSRVLDGKTPLGRGNVWDNKEEKPPLVGRETNQRLTTMLVNWGADVNLFGDKEEDLKLLRREYRVNLKTLNSLLLDEGCPAETRLTVITAFKDTLRHIINITKGSKFTMGKYLLKDIQTEELGLRKDNY